MSGTISFGGLVSGLDTNSLVDKLVAVEKLPITGYQAHQSDDRTKLSTLGSLLSDAQALASAAQSLSTSGLANPLVASASDSTVAVRAGTGASAGTHSLTITSLAQAQVNLSTGFGSDAAPGTGTLNITVGGGNPVAVSYAATDKLGDVASRINNLGIGVVASVLNDGTQYHLMITASQTGLSHALSFTESGAALGLAAQASQVVAPRDASFTLDNVPVTRASNVIGDVLPGVTLTLQAPTAQGAAPTTIALSADQSGLQTKIQALVDAYNKLAGDLSGQLKYTGAKAATNTFFGDGDLEQMQRSVAGLFAASYGPGLSADQLGVGLQKDGTLSFDTAKFQSQLAQNPSAAVQLFTGSGGNGSRGLAQSLTRLLDSYSRPIDGLLVTKQDQLNKDVSYYDTKIKQVNDDAARLDARLRAQFLAMEKALQLLNTQNSLLASLGAGASASAGSGSSIGSAGSSGSSGTVKTSG